MNINCGSLIEILSATTGIYIKEDNKAIYTKNIFTENKFWYQVIFIYLFYTTIF